MALIRHDFDSVGAAVEYSKKSAKTMALSHGERGDWYATDNFEEACQLALTGWHGVRAQIDKITSDIQTEVMEQTYTDYSPQWDTTGGVVDVEAFVNGEPECMIDFMPEPRVADRPVVTVLVNACFSAGFSSKQVLERGAAICGLVEVLMALGFSTEVYAESVVRAGKDQWSTLVKVKGVDDYADIDSFAFTLGHPSWLRRIVFGMMEGENATTRRKFGFGAPYDSGYSMPDKLTAKEDVGAVVCVESALLGRDGRNIRNPSDWIKDTLNGLGITTDTDHA